MFELKWEFTEKPQKTVDGLQNYNNGLETRHRYIKEF
jgi:hypothetical protein